MIFFVWVIITSVFTKDWVIIWVIIMTKPRSVFLFWPVVTLVKVLPKKDEKAFVQMFFL